jgi:Effector-associated domain 1
MPMLNGSQIGEVVDILSELFAPDELRQVLRVRLNLDIRVAFTSESDPGRKAAFEVVEGLDRDDRIPELLDAVQAERPRSERLKRFIAAVRSSVDAGHAAEAVASLAGRLRADPRLRGDAVQFRANFRATRDEIGLLGRYKQLHDCLHLVQLRQWAVTRAAGAFPTDPSAAFELGRYVGELREAARAAREQAAGLPTAAEELDWVDEFDQALDAARDAVRDRSHERLSDAVERLERLQQAAVGVNRSLIEAARRLRLDRLDEALGSLLGDAAAPAPDDQTLFRTLQAGRDGLRALDQRLAALVDAHDDWQRVDKALAAAGVVPAIRPAERVPRWERVKGILARLCPQGMAEDEDADPSALAGRWEQTADPTAAENLFLSVQAAARGRFVIVDKQLLGLCGELERTVGPLNSILEVL